LSSRAFLPLRDRGDLTQIGLSGFGNKKGIEMKNTVEEENVDVIHCNYMRFKVNKNLLVFKIEM
jgi:hypothetical protein